MRSLEIPLNEQIVNLHAKQLSQLEDKEPTDKKFMASILREYIDRYANLIQVHDESLNAQSNFIAAMLPISNSFESMFLRYTKIIQYQQIIIDLFTPELVANKIHEFYFFLRELLPYEEERHFIQKTLLGYLGLSLVNDEDIPQLFLDKDKLINKINIKMLEKQSISPFVRKILNGNLSKLTAFCFLRRQIWGTPDLALSRLLGQITLDQLQDFESVFYLNLLLDSANKKMHLQKKQGKDWHLCAKGTPPPVDPLITWIMQPYQNGVEGVIDYSHRILECDLTALAQSHIFFSLDGHDLRGSFKAQQFLMRLSLFFARGDLRFNFMKDETKIILFDELVKAAKGITPKDTPTSLSPFREIAAGLGAQLPQNYKGPVFDYSHYIEVLKNGFQYEIENLMDMSQESYSLLNKWNMPEGEIKKLLNRILDEVPFELMAMQVVPVTKNVTPISNMYVGDGGYLSSTGMISNIKKMIAAYAEQETTRLNFSIGETHFVLPLGSIEGLPSVAATFSYPVIIWRPGKAESYLKRLPFSFFNQIYKPNSDYEFTLGNPFFMDFNTIYFAWYKMCPHAIRIHVEDSLQNLSLADLDVINKRTMGITSPRESKVSVDTSHRVLSNPPTIKWPKNLQSQFMFREQICWAPKLRWKPEDSFLEELNPEAQISIPWKFSINDNAYRTATYPTLASSIENSPGALFEEMMIIADSDCLETSPGPNFITHNPYTLPVVGSVIKIEFYNDQVFWIKPRIMRENLEKVLVSSITEKIK